MLASLSGAQPRVRGWSEPGRYSWGSERSLRSRGAWEGPPESMRDARARLCVEVCALARAYASSDDPNQVRYLGLDGLIQRKAWMPSDFIAMR